MHASPTRSSDARRAQCLVLARDRPLAEALELELDRLGVSALGLDSLLQASAWASHHCVSAVVLDGDGFRATLRPALTTARSIVSGPVILLSSAAGEEQQIEALDAGANDVLLKPLSPRLVAAKVRRLLAIVRESSACRLPVIAVGRLRLDRERELASIGDSPLPLTTSEFGLLLGLASQPGVIVRREILWQQLDAEGDGIRDPAAGRGVDMHVCRLRRKLNDAGADEVVIDTIYGRGYRLSLILREAVDDTAGRAPFEPARTSQFGA